MQCVACRFILLLLLTLLMTPAGAADRTPPSTAQDLQYGEALYYYYQQDWFNSIVRLQIAKTQERLPNHADEAELLLGGLDLSYGLRNVASTIFERMLTNEHADEQIRNRAWFYLAKISYQRGDTVNALQALSRVSDDMTRTTRVEVSQLHSLLLLQLGQNDAAIEVLEASKDINAWSPYLAYNLGVAYIRNGQLERGAKELDTLGELSGRSEELRLLRDKANLALGYSYLQDGATQQSREILERVRLEGPLSNKALLGAGWANAEADEFGHALVPWSELGRRNATDPAVQEALLAMPYAMTRMNLHGRAVQQYNGVIGTLFDEKDKLDESIDAIRKGELLEILQGQDLRNGSGWLQELTLDTQSPALRYQVALMAAHEFQEAVKNYRDLSVLRNNLQTWATNIDAYDNMLSARQHRFANKRPAAEHALRSEDRKLFEQRHHQLRDRLAQIEGANDPVGLADTSEAEQWNKLEDIKVKLAGLPAGPDTDALRERQARAECALYWQL
ncbi:MAG: tetratricopeptide repeat protein, partial [Halobacteria archaeon]|nr:tetratricopeptide repeat protein [Halobacteria archaeon]